MGNQLQEMNNLTRRLLSFYDLILVASSSLLKAENDAYLDVLDQVFEDVKRNVGANKVTYFDYAQLRVDQKRDYDTKEILEKIDKNKGEITVVTTEGKGDDQDTYPSLDNTRFKSISFLPLCDKKECLKFIVIEEKNIVRIWTQREKELLQFLALVISKTIKVEKESLKAQEIKKESQRQQYAKNAILNNNRKESLYQTRLCGYALVVDDNRLNGLSLQRELKKEGIRVKLVASGLEAIEAAREELFDLVLMDIHMPNMDGIEATRKIRLLSESNEKIPIIALTANPFLSDYDFLKVSQMNDVLIRPFTTKKLDKILRKYISSYTSINIPEQLFIFDQNDFEQRFEGSMDIAEEVVNSFLVEYNNDLAKIKNAVAKNDVKQIREMAHYFIGSCSYLSGKRVVWLLNLLIQYAKNKQFEAMDLCVELLDEQLQKLVVKIVNYKECKIK